jgi:hypothetical protein
MYFKLNDQIDYEKICVVLSPQYHIHIIRAITMTLKMKKECLLPLFKNFMETTRGNSSIKPIILQTPIDCQVVSTTPKIVVSDGFHKVTCNMSKDAVLEWKTYYPALKLKDLNKCIITLVEHAPYTRLDADKGLQFELHVYNFRLHSLDAQRSNTILGTPKELEDTQEIKSETNFEIHKKLRRYISKQKYINELPQLEDIKYQKPIKCNERMTKPINCISLKEDLFDEAGKLMLDYKKVDQMEDVLTEEAGKLLVKRKEDIRKNKELGRELAKKMREKPRSLNKDLVQWADKFKVNNESSQRKSKTITVIQEGVARILAKENIGTRNNPRNLRSISKSSINKSIQSKRLNSEKGKVNVSEIKYNARSFKNFMNWRANGNGTEETNNVADLLQRRSPGTILVDFAVPAKPSRKAFDGWVSSKTPCRKRETPSGAGSCRKSTTKKFRL